jgi:TRAP-type mannitol/chloroaromatic compound transport system substrate-binding protein
MGFHMVAPYYYSGWHEPGTELLYFFNKESMAKLPNWAKSILRNAARLTAYNMSTSTFAANAENWHTIATEYPSVQVKVFPPEVIAALRASNDQLLESESARSPMAAKIIASRAEYLGKARAWTEIGEKAYLDSLAK